MPFYDVALTVVVCSVVQSLFGMGLLVFGTPTLLMLGYGFSDVLGFLLPASMAISALQIMDGRHRAPRLGREVYWYCLPLIAVGLAAALGGVLRVRIDLVVGTMLLATAIIRLSPPVRRLMADTVGRYQRPYLAVMGLVHGVSNMGGGLLAVYASSLHESKDAIRYTIAHHYLLFGLIQCAVLIFLGSMSLSAQTAVLALVAVGVKTVVGNWLYERASALAYHHLMTAFTGAYGGTILLRGFL